LLDLGFPGFRDTGDDDYADDAQEQAEAEPGSGVPFRLSYGLPGEGTGKSDDSND
jgi:hypothetical protein